MLCFTHSPRTLLCTRRQCYQVRQFRVLILILALFSAISHSQHTVRDAYSGKDLIVNASYHGENGYEENNSTNLMSNTSSSKDNNSFMTSVGALTIRLGSMYLFVVSSFMISYYDY
ncbi:hypothetical protein TELCIR_11861 [Teladorsagia circumcincta]|uniref:Uncharacterized protein n=1 Tax=Teladorsagia circumcincta TaxID=45464 RepID=A0A2G9U8C1_TELCI|nr:hypothetical protein TELCIR_11861 [Teladorsagia circumcincta]